MNILRLHTPIGPWELVKRTVNEINDDNVLGLSAQLAYYFFLAVFPALLFLVAVASFFPVVSLSDDLSGWLGPIVPRDVVSILQGQLVAISNRGSGGLLTIGFLGALWSSSSAVLAITDTLNRAYDVQESRPWWRVRLLALALTVVLALFLLVSFVIVVAGPTLVSTVASHVGLARPVAIAWMIAQWPVAVCLVGTAVALVYYYAPDVEQEWAWITPGSVFATVLWFAVSLGFKVYVSRFGAYNETYGTIGGVIVLLLWFYLTGLALLVGAELNSEIEHAAPEGKNPGERTMPS